MSPAVIRSHSAYHSLSLVVPLVVIRCHSLYHLLSLVVARCTTRLSFYKRSSTCVLLAKGWFMLEKKFNQNLSTYHSSKKSTHVKQKVCLSFRFMNLMMWRTKTSHGRTDRNIIKKPCWRQLPISKYLSP